MEQEKKIIIETGFSWLEGEFRLADHTFDPICECLYDIHNGHYTKIDIEENLTWEERKFKRERQIRRYRFKGTKKDLKKLKKLIPEDNPYDVYVKEFIKKNEDEES